MVLDINKDDYVAVICEGNSEKNIIKILLEEDKLIFTEDQLLDGEILGNSNRNAKKFRDKYLTLDYDKKIVILLVCDKYHSNFKINAPYDRNIKSINFIVTKPEIEMLMVCALGYEKEFYKVKQKTKASEFMKDKLGENVKSQNVIRDFYSQHSLVESIKKYSQQSYKDKKWEDMLSIIKE